MLPPLFASDAERHLSRAIGHIEEGKPLRQICREQDGPSIYGLYDRQGNLRYIGKANNPDRRLASHMRDARRRKTPLYDWINKHGCPEMRVLESNCSDWKASERRLIAESRATGVKLLNLADGGDEPFCPVEVRKANGRNSTGPNGYHQRVKTEQLVGLVHTAKREFSASLRLFENRGEHEAAERMKGRMRKLAERLPQHFPKWASI